MSTLEQTQAITSAQAANTPLKPPGLGASAEGTAGEAEARAQLEPGRGARNDDAANRSAQALQAAADAEYNSALPIQPQPNILDRFASYTYQASVYLMSPTQYQRFLGQKNKNINGYFLLFQSGGAGVNRNGEQSSVDSFSDANNGGVAPDNRNPFFDNDFYIDQVTVENVLAGKVTGAAHMSTSIKFTVVEPQGITLLDRLKSAVENIQPRDYTGNVNYSAATYLMVIRFYGYDENGKLVTVANNTLTDRNAVVEKYFPFIIRSVKWKVESKLVNYEFECAPNGQLGFGTARGTIPYDIELTAGTVGELLGGSERYTTTNPVSASPAANSRDLQRQAIERQSNQSSAETARLARSAPPKADAAPSDRRITLTQGLVNAMNSYQKDLVRRKIYTYADEYEIKFIKGAETLIAGAKITLPGSGKVDKKGIPVNQPATVAGGKALDSDRQTADLTQRTVAITAGQQMIQAIELVIRNSSYIYDQSFLVTKPDGTQEVNSNSSKKPMQWFLITCSAVPISSSIDPLRNDYAYRITYTVEPYQVPNFDSRYFPLAQFPGLHKQYNYWFTGQNSAVLDYSAEFNSLYYLTVSGSPSDTSDDMRRRMGFTSSMAEIPRYVYMAASGQSSAGGPGKSLEPSANAAEYLYSPGDLSTAKLTIVGDPAWIQQGSIVQPFSEEIVGKSPQRGFLPDGSIDFDSSQVMFELAWQRPEDYDLSTGLADPYARTSKNGLPRRPIQSFVYQAHKVTSEFKQGSFKQNIEASLYYFPKPDGTNASNAAAASAAANELQNGANQPDASARQNGIRLTDQSQAETARLAAKNSALLAINSRTSVTGTAPVSSIARGVQQILNPPTTLAAPTLTQLTNSRVYQDAVRNGTTPRAALELARQSFAGSAGGSPIISNGGAIAVAAPGTAPQKLPPAVATPPGTATPTRREF